MTLPVVESKDIRGARGPAYTVGSARCSNPGCMRWAEHAHHIVRRSETGKPYDWVEIEGVLYANLTGLCPPCHEDITGTIGGHKAAIRLVDGIFLWCLLGEVAGQIEYHPIGPLEPQPPTIEKVLGQDGEPEACPTCGQVTRRRRQAGTPQRRRKTWIVRVPADHEENGAEVLDSLVENVVPLVPNSDSSAAGRYFVLVPVLAYVLMDSKRFVETMEGVGA